LIALRLKMKRIVNFFLLPFRLLIILLTTVISGLVFISAVLFFGKSWAFNYTKVPFIWGKIFCFATGTKITVTGLENVPKDKGHVYLFSHASFLDIPIIFAAIRGEFNFAAKSYVFKIPVMGQVGRVMKSIEIKKDLHESIKEYKRAEKMVQDGESFMVAPEGTRSDKEVVNPFKSGPFLFAMGAKADLVPVLIYGAHSIWSNKEVFPNMSSFGGRVHVSVLPVVKISEFTNENRKAKAEQIRQKMSLELERLKSL